MSASLSVTEGPGGPATTHYRVDDGPWNTYSNPFVLSEGRHVVVYWSNDSSGISENVQTANVSVDITHPTFSDATPSGIVHDSHVVVSWKVADDLSGVAEVQTSLDDGPFLMSSGNGLSLELPDGSHYVTLKATDAAGNFALYVVTFQVDTSLLSPGGPYGMLPMAAVAAGFVLATEAAVLHRRARRAAREGLDSDI